MLSLNNMESLKIKNFGPIIQANLKLKKVVLLIGPQASGKSAIAKLVSILRDVAFLSEKLTFKDMLIRFGIESYLNDATEIIYETTNYKFNYSNESAQLKHIGTSFIEHLNNIDEGSVSDEKIDNYNKKREYALSALNEAKNKLSIVEDNSLEIEGIVESLKELEVIVNELTEFKKTRDKFNTKAQEIATYSKFSKYIPAERNLYSILSNTKFSFSDNNIPFPRPIQHFGSIMEQALQTVKNFKVSFLSLEYSYSDNQSYIKDLKQGGTYPLSKSSSGIQSLIPLMIIMESIAKLSLSQTFVVEEPEMNLYPETQYELIKYLVSNFRQTHTDNDLIITTHSPYCLSAINNLLTAHEASKLDIEKKHVSSVIPEQYWVDTNDFAGYFVKNGKTKSLIDKETNLIYRNELDETSHIINNDFNKLLNMVEKAFL